MEVRNVGAAFVCDSYDYPKTKYVMLQPCVKRYSTAATRYKLTEDVPDENHYAALVDSLRVTDLTGKKKPAVVADIKLFIPAEDIGSMSVLRYIRTKVLNPARKSRVFYYKHRVVGKRRDNCNVVKNIIAQIGCARKREILERFDQSQKNLERTLTALQKKGDRIRWRIV